MTDQITARRLAGAARSGSDRSGSVYHAVVVGQDIALCGATYGTRSAGWSEYHGRAVTCRRCLKKLETREVA